MARPAGLEPTTPRVGVWYSIHLSYERTVETLFSLCASHALFVSNDLNSRSLILYPAELQAHMHLLNMRFAHTYAIITQ